MSHRKRLWVYDVPNAIGGGAETLERGQSRDAQAQDIVILAIAFFWWRRVRHAERGAEGAVMLKRAFQPVGDCVPSGRKSGSSSI